MYALKCGRFASHPARAPKRAAPIGASICPPRPPAARGPQTGEAEQLLESVDLTLEGLNLGGLLLAFSPAHQQLALQHLNLAMHAGTRQTKRRRDSGNNQAETGQRGTVSIPPSRKRGEGEDGSEGSDTMRNEAGARECALTVLNALVARTSQRGGREGGR